MNGVLNFFPSNCDNAITDFIVILLSNLWLFIWVRYIFWISYPFLPRFISVQKYFGQSAYPPLPPLSKFLVQSIAGHSITPARLLLRAVTMISRARPPLPGSHGVALHRGRVREGDAGGSRGALLLPLGSVSVHGVRLRHHPGVETGDLVAGEESHLW